MLRACWWAASPVANNARSIGQGPWASFDGARNTGAPAQIVKSDPNQRLLCEEKVRQDGCEVVAVPDGREASPLIEEKKPDLVVPDIAGPGVDGLETKARMLGKDHCLPIISDAA